MLGALPVTDCGGHPIALDPAQKLVIFYRGFWCEHCRAQLTELADLTPALHRAGFSIVAISADMPVLTEAMCTMLGGRIAVMRDPGAALIENLGLADRDDAVEHVIARPAVFIVGRDSTIEFRYVSRSAEDRPTGELLLLGAESLSSAH
jgi:peroxiredoxin